MLYLKIFVFGHLTQFGVLSNFMMCFPSVFLLITRSLFRVIALDQSSFILCCQLNYTSRANVTISVVAHRASEGEVDSGDI